MGLFIFVCFWTVGVECGVEEEGEGFVAVRCVAVLYLFFLGARGVIEICWISFLFFV